MDTFNNATYYNIRLITGRFLAKSLDQVIGLVLTAHTG